MNESQKCLNENGLFMLNTVVCCLSFSYRVHAFIRRECCLHAIFTRNIELLIKLKVYRCEWWLGVVCVSAPRACKC